MMPWHKNLKGKKQQHCHSHMKILKKLPKGDRYIICIFDFVGIIFSKTTNEENKLQQHSKAGICTRMVTYRPSDL